MIMSSRDMEVVQQFNAELSSLYEVRPPISKAKMSQITRVSMKAIKMYKHIVQSVERFIIKCRPEYKIPGLYVIDSIVRQSRHQFGADKDVYAARFARNFAQTFQNLFLTCPPDDKPKIVRVLNLWQRNNVFTAETIQPLLDMANPNASLNQKFESSPQSNSRDANRDNRDSNSQIKDPNLILQLQQLANSLGLGKSGNSSSDSQQVTQNQIKFNKKLLDFDYGDEEDEEERGETPTESEPPLRSGQLDENNVTNPLALSMAQNLLSNPDLLQQLQQMQKTIQQTEILKLSLTELEVHGLTGQPSLSNQQILSAFQSTQQLSQQQQQNQSLINTETNNNSDENRKQIDLNMNFENLEQKLNNNELNLNSNQLNPNLNPNDSSFQYLQNANNFGPQLRANDLNYALNNSIIDTNQYHSHQQQSQQSFHQPFQQEINERSGSHSPRNRSPRRQRFRDRDNRYRDRSRSRSAGRSSRRDRDRTSRRSYRSSRSRSPRNSRFNDISRSPQSYERERERERRRKGLPPIRKSCLTICSTTLWLGHVPKLVSEADLSDTFGEFGAINSIDLIPSRGCAYVCMNRRQDAAKALNSLRNVKLHGSQIKMAWAPGKGMKGKEFKDYWEADEGASYIPYAKLPEDIDLDLLEEGGTVDEETVPEKLQEMRKRKNKEREEQERETAALMARAAAMMPLPMVGLSANTFGLVMPPNMLNLNQTPVMSLQSSDSSMMSTVTTTSFPQMAAPPMLSMTNKDDNLMTNSSEITEVTMTSDNETKADTNQMASNSSNVPLLPPPLPPFQSGVPPLGMPPMPPLLGAHPPTSMPWLSGPPPPIIPGNRMPGAAVPQRPPLLPLSSVPTSTTDSTITSIRPEEMSSSGASSMVKPEDRPPLIATLPLALSHEDLPPRLHPDRQMDRNFGPRDRFRPNMDRPDMDRPPHHNDDPFAPSVYELRAMERNQMMRPPIPHQMGGTGRSGLMPIPHNMNERFPFERPQRPFHPRHHNMRPDIRHHHNFERHSNHPNRGSGRDQYSNRGFGRRDRPSRWKNDDNNSGHNRHYNRNNSNSDFNSGFNNNNKFDRRHDREDREQQSDDSFNNSDNFETNSVNNDNCNQNENNLNINTNNESFDDLNCVSTKSDFNDNNNEMDVQNDIKSNIGEDVSESYEESTVDNEANAGNT